MFSQRLRALPLTEHGKHVDKNKPSAAISDESVIRLYFNKEGLIYSDSELTELADTAGMRTTFDNDRAIFAFSTSGILYMASAKTDAPPYVYHSTLTNESVAMAGLIEISQGQLTYIDNCSGHYQPSLATFIHFLIELNNLRLIQPVTIIGNVVENEGGQVSKNGLRIVTRKFSELNNDPVELSLQKSSQQAMFIINFDGITSLECGAGQFVSYQIEALNRYNESQPASVNQKMIRPFLMGPDYTNENRGFSEPLKQKNKKICAQWKGEMLPISIPEITDTSAQVWMSGIGGWQELCQQAAEKIHKQLKMLESDAAIHDVVIVIHDTNFALVSVALDQKLTKDPIRLPMVVKWVPHSTSISISGKNAWGMPIDTLRYQWELIASKVQSENFEYAILPIGEHMRQHLVTEYAISSERFQFFRSGIIREPFLIHPLLETIHAKLIENNIPIDKDLIFDMGMGLSVKGHDLTVEAFACVAHSHPNLHLVLLMPDRSDREPLEAKKIQSLIETYALQEKVTWIKEFKNDLAGYMYRYPRTLVTMLPVRESPQDLIPMEARTFPASSVLLVSNRGSNVYQVKDGIDGFIADIGRVGQETVEDLVVKLKQALSLTVEQRQAMVDAGKKKISEEYDLIRNFPDNFSSSTMHLLAKAFYQQGLLSFEKHALTHGNSAAVYVDCRTLQSRPELNQHVLSLYQQKLANITYDRICGVPFGALAEACAVAFHLNKPSVMIRSEKKEYGKGKYIEGQYKAGENVVVIEDVITTGGSALKKAILPLQRAGLVVTDVVVLFDAGKGGVQNLEQLGFKVHVIFSYCDFLQCLGVNDGLTTHDCDAIQSMVKDASTKLSISPSILSELSSLTNTHARLFSGDQARCTSDSSLDSRLSQASK